MRPCSGLFFRLGLTLKVLCSFFINCAIVAGFPQMCFKRTGENPGVSVHVGIYLWAASGSALRWERLAFRGAGLSAGDALKGMRESSRGASGLVLEWKHMDQAVNFYKGNCFLKYSTQTYFLRMITARRSLMSWGRIQWVMSSAA